MAHPILVLEQSGAKAKDPPSPGRVPLRPFFLASLKKEGQKGKREKGERGKRKARGRIGGKRRAYVLIISYPFLSSKPFRPYNASLGPAPDCIFWGGVGLGLPEPQ